MLDFCISILILSVVSNIIVTLEFWSRLDYILSTPIIFTFSFALAALLTHIGVLIYTRHFRVVVLQ